MTYFIVGLIGFSTGVFLQRVIFLVAADTVTPTVCDCCQWRKENQWHWEKRKDRHKK